ncbi:MAG: bifunctional precorrin-2 dehydrogenase/sirohydrochlorin ferrochelatase [Acidobacteria bacterium]|nr:bifunctional precorrin-2 dehydrogenase/sirohydrochlorin ferrochelatase [Acidobacteriota bacterium]
MSLSIVLQPRGRRALIVGTGPMADSKIELLQKAGYCVSHVAGPELKEDDFKGISLVVAAADVNSNRKAHQYAKQKGILVNVADVPSDCDFFFPAKVTRGPVEVAVSSSGTSPVLAQWIRDRIGQEILTDKVAHLATLLGALRPQVQRRFDTFEERRAFWRHLVPKCLSRLKETSQAEDMARLVRQAASEVMS